MYQHLMDLTGKVAVVTGANSGIGFGIAKGLASVGCNVAIWARSSDKNRAAVQALQGLAGDAEAFTCDVTDRTSVEQAATATLQRYGFIDGMFANAGMGGGARVPFLERQSSDWEQMIELNLYGALHVCQVSLACMKLQSENGRRTGRIVLTSSIASHFGTAANEHYAMTKAGLTSLARSIAVEFARYGVTANALLPGYTATDMTTGLFDNEKFVKAVMPRIPARRFGEVEDFSGAAIYLMSDLSSYHTGDALTIDGGYSVY
ncbi:SDR family NAD(P)-dependent oxidoreductase [Allopusillimonas ginsengisoli]|uniref:SDR family NAD(P)-dependent oxidoreductase n=1 Tax=Allopusillimonas ginsengisoli TaxID=453575 RepID=UPI00102252E2|nr:SDR family NAD(P)-dependent oxidoreductase [Allopusillimonas ginsengisoli]TEA77784.1 SDR family oxidoreductase [Allopusillimonas ginsengisoli]